MSVALLLLGLAARASAAPSDAPDEPDEETNEEEDEWDPSTLPGYERIHRGHTVVLVGAGTAALSFAMLTTESGPKLDAGDVLTLRAGGELLGIAGGAMVTAGGTTARRGLLERGKRMGKGFMIAELVGLGLGTAGGFCMMATERQVTTDWGGYTQPAAAGCVPLYVVGLGTTYSTAFTQVIVDAVLLGSGEGDDDDDDDDGGDEDGDQDGDEEAPDGGAGALYLGPLLAPGVVGLTVGGTFGRW